MDKSQLSVAVYKKTGIALGSDDPAFAMVELSRLGLKEAIEESVGEMIDRLKEFPGEIRSSGAAVAAQISFQGAKSVSEMLPEVRRALAADAEQLQRRMADYAATLSEGLARQVAAATRAAQAVSRGGDLIWRWLLATAVSVALAYVLGFVSGQAAEPGALSRLFGGG